MLYTDWSVAAGFRGALSITIFFLICLVEGPFWIKKPQSTSDPVLRTISLSDSIKDKFQIQRQFSSGSHGSLRIYLTRSSTSDASNINEFRTVSKFYYCSVEYSVCSIVSMFRCTCTRITFLERLSKHDQLQTVPYTRLL